MQGQHSPQSSFFGMMYADLVPADHLLRRIAAAVDLDLVSELVRDCCCPNNGRPSGSAGLQPTSAPFPDLPGGGRRERAEAERKFAEQTIHHGLRQARYWGLAKVTLRVFLTRLDATRQRLAQRDWLEADRGPPRAVLSPAAVGRR